MTDENTRLPSDSVDTSRFDRICESDIAYLRSVADALDADGTDEGPADAHNVRAIADKLERAALAAQPRDDVREAIPDGEAEHPEWLSTLLNIVRDMEDEGDRVYFGSTNDADELREVVQAFEQSSFPLRYFKRPDLHRHIAQLRAEIEALSQTDEQPRDDVRELLREARDGLDALQDISNCTCCFPDNDCCAWSKAEGLILRIDTALSQGDEQPAIHDMTDAECATAYRDLRRRANDAGFATVGEWIDAQSDTQVTEDAVDFHDILSRAELKMRNYQRRPRGQTITEQDGIEWWVFHETLTALRTDRKAVLEEAFNASRQVAAEKRAHDDHEEDLVAHGAELAASAIRALAEGAGK